jgi:hypothetical protein
VLFLLQYLCCELAELQQCGGVRCMRVQDAAHVLWRLRVAQQVDKWIEGQRKVQWCLLKIILHQHQLLAFRHTHAEASDCNVVRMLGAHCTGHACWLMHSKHLQPPVA